MPISSYIPTSAVSKPGVCTSSTRPASPYEGQVIYEIDTDKILTWTGSAWYAPWNTAWGKCTFNENTSNSSAISTEATQITADSFTFISGRLYRVTYQESQVYVNSGTPLWVACRIKDSSTILNISYVSLSGTGTQDFTFTTSYIAQISGTKTLTATLQSQSGSVIAGRSSNQRAFLLVEDIGPA